MGVEIRQTLNPSDFKLEDQENLMLEEIGEGSCLKDDATFVLLTMVSPHTVTMFNELENLFGLDAILNRKPIGLGNHVGRQCGNNIEESSSRKGNRF
jgi:hypothetical protein